jgi:hypothetical protein
MQSRRPAAKTSSRPSSRIQGNPRDPGGYAGSAKLIANAPQLKPLLVKESRIH